MSWLRSLTDRSPNPLENPERRVTGGMLQGILDEHGITVGGATHTGRTVTPDTAVRMIAVLRASSLIGGLLGSLPMEVRATDDRRREVIVPVLEQPRPDQTHFEFLEQMGMDLARWGNFFARKLPSNAPRGRVEELWREHPGSWRVEAGRTGPDNPSGISYVQLETGQRYTSRDILHVPLYSVDGYNGLSPIGAAREAVAAGLAAEEFANRLWKSGGLMQGILHTDKALDDERAERLKERWLHKIQGLNNAYDVAILDRGLQFQQLSMPPQDLQFLDARGFQVTEIARLYGLPPHLLSQQERQTSWGTGIEQNNIGFIVYTMDPTWFRRVEQRLTMHLAPPGTKVGYKIQGLMRGDSQSRAAYYTALVNIGAMTPAEVRELEDLPPLDGE